MTTPSHDAIDRAVDALHADPDDPLLRAAVRIEFARARVHAEIDRRCAVERVRTRRAALDVLARAHKALNIAARLTAHEFRRTRFLLLGDPWT